MKQLFKVLFSLVVAFFYLIGVAKAVTSHNITDLIGIFLFFFTSCLFLICYAILTQLYEYIEVAKKCFKLGVEHIVEQYSVDITYTVTRGSNTLIPNLQLVNKEYYRYYCQDHTIRVDKEDVSKYFLDPIKPTTNELTMFELCGYSDCIQTFGETYDYSKSFDELFGYYRQQGFINKIKYIIKNRDRLRTGGIR